MALDFPASPTNGQTYQGYTYSSSIGAWQAKPAAQSPFFTGATPPANPVAGDSWFNTNDGTMYVYYYDGNTYQWVEHRSQIAKNQVGLVPITPTSIALGSGTGSVASDGSITFSGASTISINGCFSASFTNYRIIFVQESASVYTDAFMRLRASGTDLTTSYYRNGVVVDGTTVTGFNEGAAGGWNNILSTHPGAASAHAHSTVEIRQPFLAKSTTAHWTVQTWSGSQNRYLAASGFQNTASSYDGFTWVLNSGTFGGTFKIYGYN